MFNAIENPYLVPFDGSFELANRRTTPPFERNKDDLKRALEKTVDEIADLQEKFYADDRHALLLVFQAMDAAGKDSTIRKVLTGVNPAGCQVFNFKQPSKRELDHDFLWRTSQRMPERGRIGVFNRSHYEEVLVVRVHPEYLGGQKLPYTTNLETLWQQRFESINDHELHLARNGTVIVKFFLNVSREEQHRRFRDRLLEPEKNWKYSAGDVSESERWPDYMHAYEQALNATSKPWAPWYAVPADSKPAMRLIVAETIEATLRSLQLKFPASDLDIDAELEKLIS